MAVAEKVVVPVVVVVVVVAVDDTFCRLRTVYIDTFLAHLNNQHERIKFTTEVDNDGKIDSPTKQAAMRIEKSSQKHIET